MERSLSNNFHKFETGYHSFSLHDEILVFKFSYKFGTYEIEQIV